MTPGLPEANECRPESAVTHPITRSIFNFSKVDFRCHMVTVIDGTNSLNNLQKHFIALALI
jgi:hypothetical protein